MPVQKGKRRKRPRSRGDREPGYAPARPAPAQTESRSGSRPARRARRQPPLWMNATLGVIMVVAGSYFTIASPGGQSLPVRLILLLGYYAIAGYYFGKAYRQYRRRRET